MTDARQQQQPAGRRKLVLGAITAAVLVSGAIIAGVLGSRANKQARPAAEKVVVKSEPSEYQQVLNALIQGNTIVVPGAADSIKQGASVVTPVGSTTAAAGGALANATAKANATAAAGSPTSTLSSLWFGSKQQQDQTAAAVEQNKLPTSALTAAAWKQIGGQRSAICFPNDGKELVTQASTPGCTVIILRRGANQAYNIRQTINITDTKIIIGNPLSLPVLNATNKIVRLFDVLPGGRLDLRGLTLYRGNGFTTPEGTRFQVGGCVRVLTGGQFTASGVIFTEPRQTLEHFLEGALGDGTEIPPILWRRNINFGGSVLVLGGTVYLNGCLFLRFRPYGNEVIYNIQIGRDLLNVAGNVVYVGTSGVNINLFANNAIVGNFLGNFAGTATIVGGGLVNVAGNQCQWGAGIQLFVGGGALVTVGWGYISVNGGLARGAFGQHTVGAGVFIQTGYTQSRVWGVGAVFNAGQTFALGAGIFQNIGGAVATTAGCYVFGGVGATYYVGSGQFRLVGYPQARTTGTQAVYGLGHSYYNGAGQIILVYVPSFIAQVTRIQAGLGTDHFLGAGLTVNVNNTRYTFQHSNAFFGEGNQVWVGAGAGVFVRNPNLSARRFSYSTTKNTYTIAGTGVRRAPSQNEIWVTKGGVYNVTQLLPGITQLNQIQGEKWAPTWKKVNAITTARWNRINNSTKARGRKRLLEAFSVQSLLAADGDNFVLDPSKLLMVNDDIKELIVRPPSATEVSTDLNNRWGGFAKAFADGLVQPREIVKVNPGRVYTNNTDCFVCNLPPYPTSSHVTGPDGVSTCETSDLCKGDSPIEALDSARAEAKTFDVDAVPGLGYIPSVTDKNGKAQLDLPDSHLLWYDFTLFCESTKAGVDPADIAQPCIAEDRLKLLLRAYTLPGNDADYGLAVSVAAVPPSLQKLDEGGLAQASLQPTVTTPSAACSGWTKYNIYLTTESPEMQQALAEEWDQIAANSTDLVTTLQDNTDPLLTGARPCGVSVEAKTKATYPTPENMPAYKPSVNNVVGPALSLGTDASIVPISDVTVGDPVKLYVQNFPKGSAINVAIADGAIGDPSKLPTVAALPAFDDDGFAELEWTAALPEGKAPGKYMLVAYQKDFPALFAPSQAIDIDLPHGAAAAATPSA